MKEYQHIEIIDFENNEIQLIGQSAGIYFYQLKSIGVAPKVGRIVLK